MDAFFLYYLGGLKMIETDFLYQVTPSTEEETQNFSNKIYAFNLKQLSLPPDTAFVSLNYVAKHDEKIIAGISSYFFWGVLYIDILFVEEKYRGKNLGIYLLQKVEDEAKAQGATLSHLDTYDFQAKDFYVKAGYEIFGTLENCPLGHNRYYMKKVF
jgi:GNAT superfamily N-acetyltransferase